MIAARAGPAVPRTGESGHSASRTGQQARPPAIVRRTYDLNDKIELVIAAAVGDMQDSA